MAIPYAAGKPAFRSINAGPNTMPLNASGSAAPMAPAFSGALPAQAQGSPPPFTGALPTQAQGSPRPFTGAPPHVAGPPVPAPTPMPSTPMPTAPTPAPAYQENKVTGLQNAAARSGNPVLQALLERQGVGRPWNGGGWKPGQGGA